MKKTILMKAVAFTILCLFMSTALTAATPFLKSTSSDMRHTTRAWYYKTPYPNYAPQGVPDFDQTQDKWEKITPGPNGIIDSPVMGDDVYNADDVCIAPGPNCQLDSNATDDDMVEWAFCGPVALANCLWWFDSRFSDPAGVPGDGTDQYPLVEDYGAGDDHSAANAPLLIESLASTLDTCNVGTTTMSMMTDGISAWLENSDLDDDYALNTYDAPTFEFVNNEIQRNQNVILLLGFYDLIVGDKAVDQEQSFFKPYRNDQLQILTWWDYQSFIPNVTRLDAIQICLVSNGPPCDVEINIYDSLNGTPIATSIMNPGVVVEPTWLQFHFDPYVPLTPNETYYFDVRQLAEGFHYEWLYANTIDFGGDPYVRGQGWMDSLPVDTLGYPFDWTFRTEYYDPPPTVERRKGHFITCAGINLQDSQIAISDPAQNIMNNTPSDHNDANNVSYDIYDVTLGSPDPEVAVEWWLPDYESIYDYAVVEQAVVLCFVPDEEAPFVELLKPANAIYFFDQQMIPFPIPLVIGPIFVEVHAEDNRSDIAKVEFFKDEILQERLQEPPFIWEWKEPGFFIYNLRVVAYDTADNYMPVAKAVIKIL